MEPKTEHHLLKDGETLEEWWQKNGLDHEKARLARKEEYERQQVEALKAIAKAMDRFKP